MSKVKGAIIFYGEGGGRLFVGGGTRIFLGSLRGGPIFFQLLKRGGPEFFRGPRGGDQIFFQELGPDFFAPSAQFFIISHLKKFKCHRRNFSFTLSM